MPQIAAAQSMAMASENLPYIIGSNSSIYSDKNQNEPQYIVCFPMRKETGRGRDGARGGAGASAAPVPNTVILSEAERGREAKSKDLKVGIRAAFRSLGCASPLGSAALGMT